MARSEARLAVDIWSDVDFRALTPTAQRMFMFVLSQPDLAHDGVIALRERRWSASAAGMTVTDVSRDLAELHATRFLIVDRDAEEVLVRSFIRRDKVYRQPNVLRAAADHLPLVVSPAIRAALAVEIERIMAEPFPEGSRTILAEMRDALPEPYIDGPEPPDGASGPGTEPTPAEVPEGDVSAGDEGCGNPSNTPSPGGSGGTPGVRGVVTVVPQGVSPYPVPRTPSPIPALAEPETLDVEIVDPPPNLPAVVAINGGTINREWIDFCTSRGVKLTGQTIKRYGAAIKRALDEHFEPELIKRALAQMLADNEAARPSLFDQYLVRAQTGKPKGPGRMTPGERTADRFVNGQNGAAVRAVLADILAPTQEAS